MLLIKAKHYGGTFVDTGYVANSTKHDIISDSEDRITGSEWLKYSISIWDDYKTCKEKLFKHPASFPISLAEKLIKVYSKVNDLILDPFMGIGSTLIASAETNRRSVGFDINNEYISIANDRLNSYKLVNKIINDSSENIIQYLPLSSVDLCITSPPYWDILNRHRTADNKEIRNYGNDALDIGNISDYDVYLSKLHKVFFSVFQCLKLNKHCIIVVMDIRKKEKFYPLHLDLTNLMREIGFQLEDYIIWDRRKEYNNLRPLGYPWVFRVNKVHEYICIFKKVGGRR